VGSIRPTEHRNHADEYSDPSRRRSGCLTLSFSICPIRGFPHGKQIQPCVRCGVTVRLCWDNVCVIPCTASKNSPREVSQGAEGWEKWKGIERWRGDHCPKELLQDLDSPGHSARGRVRL